MKLLAALAAYTSKLRLGLRFAFWLVLAGKIERHGSPDDFLQGRLIDFFPFVHIDGAPDIPFEAGVEETGRVGQRSSLGKRHLDVVLVRLSRADDAATLASVFPGQSPSSLIFWSMNAEADSIRFFRTARN